MNFYYTRNDTIYEYYPALLIGLSTMVGFIPFRMCYYASRMWLLTSLVSIGFKPRRLVVQF